MTSINRAGRNVMAARAVIPQGALSAVCAGSAMLCRHAHAVSSARVKLAVAVKRVRGQQKVLSRHHAIWLLLYVYH